MPDEQKDPKALTEADAGIDKQSVLNEINKAVQPQDSAPAPLPDKVPEPPKTPKPAAPAPVSVPGSVSTSKGPDPKQGEPSSPESAVPAGGLWADLYRHRQGISVTICLAVGILWLVIGLASGKVVPYVLAFLFLVPTFLSVMSSQSK